MSTSTARIVARYAAAYEVVLKKKPDIRVHGGWIMLNEHTTMRPAELEAAAVRLEARIPKDVVWTTP